MDNDEPIIGEPVVIRFFEALEYLKREKVVHGISAVTDCLGIDRRNLYKVKRDPNNRSLRLSWLTGIVVNYHISARWLLTGKGDIIDDKT